MSKQSDLDLVKALGSNLSAAANAPAADLEGVVPGFNYAPTDDIRALKSRFWLLFKANQICDEDQITPAVVEEVTGRSLKGHMGHPAFWGWFSNQRVTEIMIEMAAERASETALRMLDPSFPLNDNARVQLIKYVLEFSGRSPPTRRDVKWLDKEVGALDEKDLDAMIEKHLARRALKPS